MDRQDLSKIWAVNSPTRRREPDQDKYNLGWVSEIPTFQVFNWLQYRTDKNLWELSRRGVFEWGSDINYLTNSVAWDNADGGMYVSLVDNPSKLLSPKDNPTEWEKSAIQSITLDIDGLKTTVEAHVNDFNNPHQITADAIDTYTRDEIDHMQVIVDSAIYTHMADRDNPHRDTAENVGAVPITGGTYTGTISFSTGNILVGNTGELTNKDYNGRTTGVYLKDSDNSRIGVENDRPVFISKYGIVYPITYGSGSLLDGYEMVSATPTPLVNMPLIFDTLLYSAGQGTYSTYSGMINEQPEFVRNDGLMLQMATTDANQDKLLIKTEAGVVDEFTIAFVFGHSQWQNSYIENMSILSIGGKSLLSVRNDLSSVRVMELWIDGVDVPEKIYSSQSNPILRIVVTYRGDRLSVYINGGKTLLKDFPGIYNPIDSTDIKFEWRDNSGSGSPIGGIKYTVRDIKFWTESLNPAQVAACL